MKKNKILLFIMSFLVIFSVTVCTQARKESDIPSITSESDISTYLKSKGYTLLADIEKFDSKKISKEDFKGSINGMIWIFQAFSPEQIEGQIIDYYTVDVKNHPLGKILKLTEDETINITIMKCSNKIIGGYSSVKNKERYVRLGFNIYSLDGKTLEEYTGQDYQTWRKNWEKKYS